MSTDADVDEVHDESAVEDAAAKAACQIVVSVEMSMGQMVEDVERSVHGKRPVRWFGKSGGDVPTPEEVIDAVKSFVKEIQ